jgi:hypothetical protein
MCPAALPIPFVRCWCGMERQRQHCAAAQRRGTLPSCRQHPFFAHTVHSIVPIALSAIRRPAAGLCHSEAQQADPLGRGGHPEAGRPRPRGHPGCRGARPGEPRHRGGAAGAAAHGGQPARQLRALAQPLPPPHPRGAGAHAGRRHHGRLQLPGELDRAGTVAVHRIFSSRTKRSHTHAHFFILSGCMLLLVLLGT